MAVHNQEFFDGSLPANFDGLFDWDLLTEHAFSRFSKINLMDIDAVCEKNRRFLHFETKIKGSDIPTGQKITMQAYHSLGCVTYILIFFDTDEKKHYINHIKVWYPNDEAAITVTKPTDSYSDKYNLLIKLAIDWMKDAENKGKLTIKQPIKKESWLHSKMNWVTAKAGTLFQKFQK